MSTVTEREAIAVRSAKLNHLVLGRGGPIDMANKNLVNRDSLLDALVALYDECNNETMRRERDVATFLERYRGVMTELRKLRVNVHDFEVKKIIGRGHFGEVQVVKEKATGEVYAMKILRKSETLSQQNVAFYEEERDIMAKAHCPWITQLFYAFQDHTNLYLVMEFLPGGDLLALLDRYDNVLSEEMARFYMSELVVAINSLHQMGYVHRDVKPDNVLVDRSGHIKLADFGSAAKLTSKKIVSSRMPVGTPDYIAPEVLQAMNGHGAMTYGTGCDWWSLGICAYEMLYGQTPFSDDKVVTTYANIMNFKKSLKFDPEMEVSEDAINLIRGLLASSEERMNYEQLVQHPFFTDVNWSNIRQVVPPFIPNLSGLDDTSNFDEIEHENARPSAYSLKTKKEFDGRNLPFIGFTHTTTQATTTGATLERSNSIMETTTSNGTLARGGDSKRTKELLERISQLTAKESSLNEELQKVNARSKDSDSRLKTLEGELEKAEKDTAELRAELKSTQALLAMERKNRLISEEKAIQLVKGIKAKYKKQDELLKMTLDSPVPSSAGEGQVALQISAVREELDRRKREVEDLHRELSEQRNICSEYRQKLCMALEKGSKDVGQVQQLQEENLAYVESLRKELDQTIRGRDRAEEELSRCRETFEAYQNRIANLDSLNKSLTERVNGLEELVQSLQAKLKSAVSTETSCHDRNNELVSDCSLLIEKMQEAQKCNEKLQLEVDRLKADVQRLENSLEDQQRRDTTCPVCSGKVKLDAQELQDEVDSLRQVIARLEGTVDKKANEEARDVSRKYHQDFENLEKSYNAKIELLKKQHQEELFALEKKHSQKVEELHQLARISKDELDKAIPTIKRLQTNAREEKQAGEEGSGEKVENVGSHQSSGESAVGTMSKDDLEKRVETLQRRNQVLEDLLKSKREEINNLKEQLKQTCKENREERVRLYRDNLSSRRDLEQKCANQSDEVKEYTKKLMNLESEVTRLKEENARLSNDLGSTKDAISRESTKSQRFEHEATTLKEACQKMDRQFTDFEKVISMLRTQNAKLESDGKLHRTALTKAQTRVAQLERELFEVKGQKGQFEVTIKELQSDKEGLQLELSAEIDSLRQQLASYRSSYEEATQRLNQLEKALSLNEAEMKAKDRRLALLEGESIKIKEEAANHITTISGLKQNVMQLSREVDENHDKYEKMLDYVEQLQNDNEKQKATHEVELVKLQQTVSQQSKLIDFLQTKANEKKPRKGFFGSSKIPTATHSAQQLSDTERSLERERAKCRRLQEELEKSRAEAMALIKSREHTPPSRQSSSHNTSPSSGGSGGMTSSSSSSHQYTGGSASLPAPPTAAAVSSLIPTSPKSRAVLSAITKSPAPAPHQQQNDDVPQQRMHHNIPHRFHSYLNMRASKCAACLDTVHFGRHATKCLECQMVCHTKCAPSLPNTCGLPVEFVHQYTDTMVSGLLENNPGSHVKFAPGVPEASFDINRPEGWVKVPKGKAGWDKCYMILEGGHLYLFDKANGPGTPLGKALDRIALCAPDGETVVNSAVSAAELLDTAKSDIPYVLKIETRINNKPPKSYYIMVSSFSEKKMWVSVLEAASTANKRNNNTLRNAMLDTIAQLKGRELLDINCACEYSFETLLLGAMEGLFVLDLVNGRLKRQIKGITGPVYQIAIIEKFNMIVIITENDHLLKRCRLSDVKAWCEYPESIGAPGSLSAPPITSFEGVRTSHLFSLSPTQEFLTTATDRRISILAWQPAYQAFVVMKEYETSEPCSCIAYTPYTVVYGTDVFHQVDLKNYQKEEFLDETDTTLSFLLYGATQLRSFPVAIMDVSRSKKDPQEYLLCFHELGVFVNDEGRRSRPEDLKWTRIPVAFSYHAPCLFILYFNSIEVIEIKHGGSLDSGAHMNIEVSSPRLLGFSSIPSALFIAAQAQKSNNSNAVDIILVNGKQNNLATTPFNAQLDSSGDGDADEFSFTSSCLEAIEQ